MLRTFASVVILALAFGGAIDAAEPTTAQPTLLLAGARTVADAAAAAARERHAGGAIAVVDTEAAPAPAGSAPVTYIGASDVAAAFAKGRPLIETDAYKIHASRREGPGMAEVHVRDTDIIYVLEGGATFVTGGTVVEPKTTAPDEIRGTAVDGGETRTIAKGDVIAVPNGVPHWFREVKAPLLYYVVKVTAPAGGSR